MTDSGAHIFSQGCTWGVAYQVQGEQVSEALKYLNVREAVLGGYDTKEVTFYPQDTPDQPLKARNKIITKQRGPHQTYLLHLRGNHKHQNATNRLEENIYKQGD